MFCTQCGVELAEADNFCPRCGMAAKPGFTARTGETRRLVRTMENKKIAGVCAGFADYFGVDVVLVRVIWLAAALMTGVGFIAYLVAWIVMPAERRPVGAAATQRA